MKHKEIDWQMYTDNHTHPSRPGRVEVVAYERMVGGWDVYVFEPIGACPELEGGRADDQHIFIETINDSDELDRVNEDICTRLGPGYEFAVYFRESDGRRAIGKIVDHLKQRGATGMHVRAVPDTSDWELCIRRKDFELAGEVAKSNIVR
jgi:hypothetical protein